MRVGIRGKTKRVILAPGEDHVTDENLIISTLLGSCVSACLYDPIRRVAGMNHFLLGTKGFHSDIPVCETEPGKYGICSMDRLVDGMLGLGAKYENLRAKVFGAASMFRPFDECRISFCVGDVNQRFILEYLKRNKIRLLAQDTGGETGRVVHFHCDDFSVYVRKIRKSANPGLVRRDDALWRRSLGSGMSEI